ncbi:hypothetical protein EVAR_78054_1 [Eumeta japonica]|uniref:Uncharacterized protein n=1 Tax=Eumeta variegata TaxID=151549 RepID=A0A4C1T2U8_EUMVA|nr:hypothetical protein EVAR_78054_1 [Eumeta japonica]
MLKTSRSGCSVDSSLYNLHIPGTKSGSLLSVSIRAATTLLTIDVVVHLDGTPFVGAAPRDMIATNVLWCCWCITWVTGSVLDPALYLAPGPPLAPAGADLPAAARWSRRGAVRPARDAEDEDELLVVPLEDNADRADENPKLEQESELMDKAETFWSGLNTHSYGLYGVPLSFRPSGWYGGYGTGVRPSGGVAAGYRAVVAGPDDDKGHAGNYGKDALAGSGYGTYGYGGIRFYGSESGPSWTGWGNGKWGHYGKG